jgi:predicted amidohydrolase YtcJ
MAPRHFFIATAMVGVLTGVIWDTCFCRGLDQRQVQAEKKAESPPADLILHHARVVTVDERMSIAEALAVREGRIIAVGKNTDVLRWQGPKTTMIDAQGRMVLPGLYDSHTHPLQAAWSEAEGPLPQFRSVAEVLEAIRAQAQRTPKGEWIVIRYGFPTRLKEARFPTRAELDAAAPEHPVLYHAGPAGVVNSLGLKISGITRNTKDPPAGQIVRDPKTGEPTGLLRNAYGVLKGVPSGGERLTPEQRQAAVKKLFALYNAHGLTSISDRNAGPNALKLYRDLQQRGELTVRVNVARSFSPTGNADDIIRRLEQLLGPDKQDGPTGAGDDWVRIGPIKIFLDGGMLNGTAYMRQPWPQGEAYQVTEENYRGLLFVPPEQLQTFCVEAARRRWAVTAHCAGEAAMDVLLDAYEFADRFVPIRDLRFCITHANFPSQHNLERCRKLGVCADIQPAWLYKDGDTLLRLLGPERMRWFQPYQSWWKYTTIGGGSDHMIRTDPFHSTNPWSPWLGMWVAITRRLESGQVHQPGEALTREQALRLYTINNAYLHREEKRKGSLEVGKLADFILIDRDIFTCPVDDIRDTRVLLTVVGGRIVYDRR